MAGNVFMAQTAKVALTAATIKSVIQVTAPTNTRLRVVGWGVFFDGTSSTAVPVQAQLVRHLTSGTFSGSGGAVAPINNATETMQSTVLYNASAEPTFGGITDVVMCHPQQGYEVRFPPGQEVIVTGGGRIGISCEAPAGVNVRAKLVFEE